MNLRRILDALSVKKQVALYRALPEIDRRNFFFSLASKVAPHLLNREKSHKDTNLKTEMGIHGNKITFTYPKLSLIVNGVRIEAKGQGIPWLVDAIHGIFAAESNGELVIKRPEGYSRKKERLQFKQATGTCFPNIVNSVAYASGEQDLDVKGTIANKLFLTERQFEQANRPESFKKHSNSKCSYYIKNGTHFMDLTESVKSATRVIYALLNIEQPNQAAFVARTDNLSEIILDPDITNPYYVIVVGEEVFVATAHEGRSPTIKEIKVDKPKVEIRELSREEQAEVDKEYERFKDWCKDNNLHVNAKSYSLFTEALELGEVEI